MGVANLLLNASWNGVLRSPMFSLKYAWFNGPAANKEVEKFVNLKTSTVFVCDENKRELKILGLLFLLIRWHECTHS